VQSNRDGLIHSTRGLTIPHPWPRAPRVAKISDMNHVAFDTLKLAKGLEEAGFPPNQAAGTASALGEAMTELQANLVTKSEFAAFRAETRHEFEHVRHDFELVRRDLAALELRMTVKLGGMLAGAIGLTAAMVKLL
jgi:hypothetical protein